jgi:hypothetical protein
MIVVLILFAIAFYLIPRGSNQPKRKAKKFGEGMFMDIKDSDQAVHYANQYIP